MTALRFLAVLWGGTLVLTAAWVGTVYLLAQGALLTRWTAPPLALDPENEALAALEDLYRLPAYTRERTT